MRHLSLIACLILLLSVCSASAVSFSAADLRSRLQKNLAHEGYIGQFRNGQQFQRGVSAYLWDHRQQFHTTDFHNAKQLDALTCLMFEKGYANLADFSSERNFVDGCQQLLR